MQTVKESNLNFFSPMVEGGSHACDPPSLLIQVFVLKKVRNPCPKISDRGEPDRR